MTFAEALTEAMTARGMTCAALARQVGSPSGTVVHIRRGDREPSHEMAVRLADALSAPHLAQMSATRLRRKCELCGRKFIARIKAHRQRFCNRRCFEAHVSRERKGRPGRYEKIARWQYRDIQLAVDAMCRACEPVDRVCRDGVCPLRQFSPFPLVERKAA